MIAGRTTLLSGVLASLLGTMACSDGPQEPGPPGGADTSVARLDTVASGLAFPLYLTTPPGDTGRIFVVEKAGRIRIIAGGTLLPTAFLDIGGQVSTDGEQGLLGLAFHPDYATNGRFFVNYTDPAGDTRIVAYRVSADPALADPASAEVLLTVDQPYSNHNGGHIAFGPDGFLYVALGDGGSDGDPENRAQSLADHLGSLLRLDVAAAGGYTVPPDNPFVNTAGAAPELWDFGLRNPWRFSWDRETGDLYIGDVGQEAREEIDVAPATAGAGRGLNYGWNLMEGLACYLPDCDPTGLTLPVLDYSHADGCSVTGGYVYRGAAIPEIAGLYFYADLCAGWVRSFRYAGGEATEHREWPRLRTGGQIPSFGEDAAGELYVLDAGGTVYRIVHR